MAKEKVIKFIFTKNIFGLSIKINNNNLTLGISLNLLDLLLNKGIFK